MAKQKLEQFITINNEKFKLIIPPIIQSDNKFIYIEEIKDSGALRLLSSYINIVPSEIYCINLYTEDKKLYIGFINSNGTIDNAYESIQITMITRLNIGKKRLLYIEEYPEGTRLTYSEGIAKELKDLQFIEIRRG